MSLSGPDPVHCAWHEWQIQNNARRGGSSFSFAIERRLHAAVQVLAHSVYSTTLQEYWKHFQKEQVLVVLAEEFQHEPKSFVKRIEEHVGLEPFEFKVCSHHACKQ